VAMPLMRCMKFSTTRSATKMLCAAPSQEAYSLFRRSSAAQALSKARARTRALDDAELVAALQAPAVLHRPLRLARRQAAAWRRRAAYETRRTTSVGSTCCSTMSASACPARMPSACAKTARASARSRCASTPSQARLCQQRRGAQRAGGNAGRRRAVSQQHSCRSRTHSRSHARTHARGQRRDVAHAACVLFQRSCDDLRRRAARHTTAALRERTNSLQRTAAML
jgi:hypothetical protein